jgi:glycosyltransferase involved in cell wall biosynthesis
MTLSNGTTGLRETEVPAKLPGTPGRYRTIVSVNNNEARTQNFIRELNRRGFQVLPFQMKSFRDMFRGLFSFAQAILKADFALFGTGSPSQIPWMLAARLLGRPCLLDFPMDLTEWPFPNGLRGRWYAWTVLHCATRVLTIKSRAYMVDKYRLPAGRVSFIESCPDPLLVEWARLATPRFRRRPDTLLVCWSGGHNHHRLERFMPTFQRLIDLLPNIELLLIADPAKESVIESQRYAQSAGFGDRIHVLPVIKPAEDFYATVAQCDLWVSTMGDDTLQGRQEFRTELLEVGLLAKAVVSARTPGSVEHGLVDGEEILYINPSDPAGNARKIADLVSTPQARERLGNQLRARVIQAFSLKEAVDGLLDSVALPVRRHVNS